MSEFKFACPVCGQHITADSSTSGKQLECPTCFRKIVVPQAPASEESKFILSAAQVSKPRTSTLDTHSSLPPKEKPGSPLLPVIGIVVVLALAGAGAWFFRDKLFSRRADTPIAATNQAPQKAAAPTTVYPVPTNIVWSLSLTNNDIPDATVVGSIHGHGFQCERATLQGPALSLRQVKQGSADLGVTIHFFVKEGEELSGKTIEITPDRQPPLPKVVLRWKEDQPKTAYENYPSGYALRVIFGDVANGKISGQIYLALPDGTKSYIGGTFDADIRKAAPPTKKGAPKTPKAPKAKT